MVRIEIKGNFLKTQKALESVNSDMKNGTFLMKLASLLNSSIQRRVQGSGKGAYNRNLPEYKQPYKDFRQKRGRQVQFRDLTFSGKMWQSLTFERLGQNVKMFFGSVEQANKARGNNKRTPFFRISDKEKEIIRRELGNLVGKIK